MPGTSGHPARRSGAIGLRALNPQMPELRPCLRGADSIGPNEVGSVALDQQRAIAAKITMDRIVRRHRSTSANIHDWAGRAEEALAEARKLPKGAARNEALKKASQLRLAADMKGILFAKRGRPAKRD